MEKYEVLCTVTLVLEAESRADASVKAMAKLADVGIAPSVVDVEGGGEE
jgi:hypothetical protein